MAKKCHIGFIHTDDDKVYTVAYTQSNILHSQIGISMRYYAEERFKRPIHFCATWKYIPDKECVSVSLRDPIPGINLASIARSIKGTYGKGGGHTDAASFTFFGIDNFHKFIHKEMPNLKFP
jgi:hypothetical protein